MMTSSTKSSFYDPAVAKQPAVEATIGIIHDETDAIDERDDGSGGTATAVEEPRIKDIRENRSQVVVSSMKEEQVSIKTLQDNLAAALAAMAEMTDNEEDLKQKLEQVLSRTNYLLDHAAHTKPLFPNYYNRAGVGTKWHYPGHTTDLLRVICAYYALLIRHPCIAMRGMSWSLKELFDRLAILSPSKKAILKQLAFPLSFVVPIVGIPIFFALATLPCVPKPQQFNKFSGCGLMNYCVMLLCVQIMHTNIRHFYNTPPEQASMFASKTYWREFFNMHLQHGRAPLGFWKRIDGVESGDWPHASDQSCEVITKPNDAGAGYYIYRFKYDPETRTYTTLNTDGTLDNIPKTMKANVWEEWVKSTYQNVVLEEYIAPKSGLPIHSLRILTLRVGEQSKYLSSALLVAPKDSISTAHCDVQPYQIQDGIVYAICNPDADTQWLGTNIPQMESMVQECCRMHDRLPQGQIEVSWDILLTDSKPVYLEGNIIPPGCDYKLMIFENDSNLWWFYQTYIQEIARLEQQKGSVCPIHGRFVQGASAAALLALTLQWYLQN